MSEYIMDPGARLEVGRRGKLYETLGSLVGAFSPGVTYNIAPASSAGGTMVTSVPGPTSQPPLQVAPPGMVPGVTPAGYPPGYVPPMDTGVGFLGPDTNLYLIAGAVGIAGFIMWRRRHAAPSSPASNPARRRRRRRGHRR